MDWAAETSSSKTKQGKSKAVTKLLSMIDWQPIKAILSCGICKQTFLLIWRPFWFLLFQIAIMGCPGGQIHINLPPEHPIMYLQKGLPYWLTWIGVPERISLWLALSCLITFASWKCKGNQITKKKTLRFVYPFKSDNVTSFPFIELW